MKQFVWCVYLSIIALGAPFAFAQQPPQGELQQPMAGPGIGAQDVIRDGEAAVSCFDFYTFGSVYPQMTAVGGTGTPGADVTFTGTLLNKNPYPITNPLIYVKIFRTVTSDAEKVHQNGHPLVAAFDIAGPAALAAQGSAPLTITWTVPENAIAGEYYAAFYVIDSQRFNMAGLSFSDDVIGSRASFVVGGTQKTGVFFDKNTVTINEKPFAFAAYPPHIDAKDPMTIAATLVNTTATAAVVSVQWEEYQWDGLRGDAYQKDTTQTVTVPANGSARVTQTIDTTRIGAVPFVIVRAAQGASQSILMVRAVRDGVAGSRLNFAGVTTYPLSPDTDNELVACAHSMNDPVLHDVTVTSVLTDVSGAEVQRLTYTGDVTGEIMGFAQKFRPKTTLRDFTITTTLSQGDMEIDRVVQQYRCAEIDPEQCDIASTTQGAQEAPQNPEMRDTSVPRYPRGLLAVGVGSMLVLSIVLLIVSRRLRRGVLSAFFIAGCATAMGTMPSDAHAATVTWNGNANGKSFVYRFDRTLQCANGKTWHPQEWITALRDPQFSVLYEGYVRNVTKGNVIVGDGATVEVGDQLKFERRTPADTDIFWFGTGYASDSPYGHWKTNADAPTNMCQAGDFTAHTTFSYNNKTAHSDVYIAFNVAPTVQTTAYATGAGRATLSCTTPDTCTVTSPGTIAWTMTFPETYGKLYHSYYDYRSDTATDGVSCTAQLTPGCYGTTTPMQLPPNTTPISSGTWWYTGATNPYVQTVPQQTVTVNLSAVTKNNPPTPPIISGSTTVQVGTAMTFGAVSTDPDGDTLRYGFDWNRDSAVDAWVPATTYVASGTSQSATNTWSTNGTMTFQVLAQDSKGANSTWSLHTLQPEVAVCGDGRTQSWNGEQCDDGNSNGTSKACNLRCQKTTCGDGTVQTPNGAGSNEQCDDGNTTSGDGCSNSCGIESPVTGVCGSASTVTSCTSPQSGLCASGSAGTVSYSATTNRWSWSCGATTCSTKKQCGYTEVNP